MHQRIDTRFDLTSAQDEQLETDITAFAVWHRREELPRYALQIQHLESAIAEGLTRVEVEEFVVSFRDARTRLLARAIPYAVEFLYTVNSEQIAEFEVKHREAMEEDSERLALPHDEQSELRFTRAMDNLEDWFGDFDEVQSKRIRELVDALPEGHERWLKRREFQHRRFVALLQSKPTRARLEEQLRAWWLSDTADLPPEMRADREMFWNSGVTFTLAVDELLSEPQRRHATRKLQNYRQDFVRLSKAVPAPERESPRS